MGGGNWGALLSNGKYFQWVRVGETLERHHSEDIDDAPCFSWGSHMRSKPWTAGGTEDWGLWHERGGLGSALSSCSPPGFGCTYEDRLDLGHRSAAVTRQTKAPCSQDWLRLGEDVPPLQRVAFGVDRNQNLMPQGCQVIWRLWNNLPLSWIFQSLLALFLHQRLNYISTDDPTCVSVRILLRIYHIIALQELNESRWTGTIWYD